MPEFNVRVSQQGYDVGNAPDLNLLFSNKTNPLKTQQDVLTGKFQFNTTAEGLQEWTICNHNLGYRPVFIIFHIASQTTYYSPPDPIFGWPGGDQTIALSELQRDFSSNFNADKHKLYFVANFADHPFTGDDFTSASGEYYYMIFRQPVDEKVSYPVEAGGRSEPVFNEVQDFAIEMTRPGKDTSSAEADDYLFSSRYPTFSLVKIDSPGRTGIVSHGLGYVPFFFMFYKLTTNPDRIHQVQTSIDNSPTDFLKAVADNDKITITAGTTGFSAGVTESWVVILRDYI